MLNPLNLELGLEKRYFFENETQNSKLTMRFCSIMAEKLSPKLGISINELMSEEAAAAAAAAKRSAVW